MLDVNSERAVSILLQWRKPAFGQSLQSKDDRKMERTYMLDEDPEPLHEPVNPKASLIIEGPCYVR